MRQVSHFQQSPQAKKEELQTEYKRLHFLAHSSEAKTLPTNYKELTSKIWQLRKQLVVNSYK